MAIIQGTNGNDVLTGGIGDDLIIGSAGDDTLSSGGGNDTLDYSGLGQPITASQGVVNKGSLGIDRITNFPNLVGATGQANTLDTTGARGGAKIDIDLTKNTLNISSFQLNGVTIPIPETKVFNFVNALGGPNDDKLVGSNTGGKLTGAGGNDTIVGGKGKDIITGSDSTARGVGEVDILIGGGGRDRFVLGDSSGAYYVGQGNNDYATISDFNFRQDSLDLGSVQNISFKNDLPADVQNIIQQHEAAGTTQDPEYKQAIEVFNHNFLCRLNPWPNCLTTAYSKAGTEFRGAGKIIDWNVENRLSEISVPTLLMSGRYDEVTPACVEKLKQGISGAEWVLFENSSHMPHLEETERFLQVLDEFLSRVECDYLR